MQSTLKNIAILLLTILTASFTFAQKRNDKSPTSISLTDAIEKKILEFQISGFAGSSMISDEIDGDGLHFGKCMAIRVLSKIDSLVVIRIESGTELIPFDSSFQTMIVTKTIEFPMYPRTGYTSRFYAMCGQIHDSAPYIESLYTIGELSDNTTVKIAKYFEKNYIQNIAGQHALWAYRDKVGEKELKKYGADNASLSLTKKILNELKINTKLNDEKPVLKVKDDNTIQIRKIVFYCLIGLSSFLLIATVYLLFEVKKNKS
jgi:hypothetical protein